MLALPRSKEVEMNFWFVGALVGSYMLATGATFVLAIIADVFRNLFAVLVAVVVMMGMMMGLGWVGHMAIAAQHEAWARGVMLVVYSVCAALVAVIAWNQVQYPDSHHKHRNHVAVLATAMTLMPPFNEWLYVIRTF